MSHKNRTFRALCLLLSCLILLSLCACGLSRESEEGRALTFYYAVRDADHLQTDETVAEEVRIESVVSVPDFIDLYLRGPEDDNLVSPFPPGTRALNVRREDAALEITMSMEFFSLMGVDMSVAVCCLTRTLCPYAGVDRLVLADETGGIRMEAAPEQFLLSGDFREDTGETFTLYFSDRDRRYLIPETRTAILSPNETGAVYVMRRLLEGPESDQLLPVLPEGTELRGVNVSEGICTLDLSKGFYTGRPGEDGADYLTLYGVVNTLTGLEDVSAVRFLEEGAPVDSYGIFPMGEPLLRNTECIGPVRMASGEVDADLYMRADTGAGSFPFPCRVKQTISEPLAQAVMTRLLSFEPTQGFYNPIPYGTELISISVSGTRCYVDLSERMVPQEDTEAAEREALWTLVMTLTDLEGINAVVLTIAGESSGFQYVDISEPLTRESVALE